MSLTAQIEEQIRGLPGKRRRVVVEGLNELARELIERSLATDALGKVQTASRAAVDFIEVLMTAESKHLARLARLLTDLRAETTAEEMQDEELEASGRLQLLAFYRAVEEESLSVRELESAGIQRQRLQQLRDQDRLLGIRLPFQRGFLYPRWQFGEDFRPKPFLPEVLAAAREKGLDALTVHRLMVNPGAGGGTPPFELCEQGRTDLALNVLRTAGESGG